MAEPKLRSACYDCPPEDRQPDSDRCQNCKKRIDRLNEIDSENITPQLSVVGGRKKVKRLTKKLKKEIESTIRNICKRTKVDYDKELMADVQDNHVAMIRKHCIMIIQKVYKLTDGAIAEIFNVSPQYVNHVIATRNYDLNESMVTFFGENLDPHDPDDVITESMIDSGYLMLIDFSNYPNLFKEICRLASNEMRPRRLQVLFMLQAFIDREMSLNEG